MANTGSNRETSHIARIYGKSKGMVGKAGENRCGFSAPDAHLGPPDQAVLTAEQSQVAVYLIGLASA